MLLGVRYVTTDVFLNARKLHNFLGKIEKNFHEEVRTPLWPLWALWARSGLIPGFQDIFQRPTGISEYKPIPFAVTSDFGMCWVSMSGRPFANILQATILKFVSVGLATQTKHEKQNLTEGQRRDK